MKYIDADLLRKDIEFAKSVYNNPKRVVYGVADAFRQDGRAAMCDDILKKIDSLQQEQPDFPTTDEQMKEFLATHPKIKVPEKYKNPDWVFKKQEQQEVDLEDEMEKFGERWPYPASFDGYDKDWVDELTEECAKHFYELGKNSK